MKTNLILGCAFLAILVAAEIYVDRRAIQDQQGIVQQMANERNDSASLDHAFRQVMAQEKANGEIAGGKGIDSTSTRADPDPRTVSERLDAVDRAIGQIPLREQDSRLAQALGRDEIGVRLWRFLMLSRYRDEIPEGKDLIQAFLQETWAKPEASIGALNEGLSRIREPEHGFARARLLEVVAMLPGAREEKRELAAAEMVVPDTDRAPAAQDVNGIVVLKAAVIAHTIFLNTTTEPSRALRGTLEAVRAQREGDVRRMIIGHFRAQFPDLEKDLNEALAHDR